MHDWVGKVIHWELYKRLKFELTIKWYMHELDSILEKEKHNILCDGGPNGSPSSTQKTRNSII